MQTAYYSEEMSDITWQWRQVRFERRAKESGKTAPMDIKTMRKFGTVSCHPPLARWHVFLLSFSSVRTAGIHIFLISFTEFFRGSHEANPRQACFNLRVGLTGRLANCSLAFSHR